MRRTCGLAVYLTDNIAKHFGEQTILQNGLALLDYGESFLCYQTHE